MKIKLAIAVTLGTIFLSSMQNSSLISAGDSNFTIFINEINKYPDITPRISHSKLAHNNTNITIDFSHEGKVDKEFREYLIDIGFSIYSFVPASIKSVISRVLTSSDLENFMQELTQMNSPCAAVIRKYLEAI